MDQKTRKIDQLKKLIDHYSNGVKSDFADQIGLSSQALNNWLNRGTFDAELIYNSFNDVSPDWLLSGNGDLTKKGISFPAGQNEYSEVQEVHHPKYAEPRIYEQYVPYYSIEATAGVMELMDMSPEYEIGKIIVPNMPRCDGAVAITGDSMYPLLKSGDIVAFQLIHDINNIHYGDMYLVSINEDGDTYFSVKWVNKHPTDPSKAILVSSNEHYAPREVELRHIHRIALIKFSIRYNSMG